MQRGCRRPWLGSARNHATGLLCRERQELLSSNWAAKVEVFLDSAGPRTTRVDLSAINFGWGRIQKNHLIGQVGNLRNKIVVSASRAGKSGQARNDGDLSAELMRLAELRSRGALTEEEFAAAKARLLEL